MTNVSTVTQSTNDVAEYVAPVIVNPQGATSAERKLDVVHSTTSRSTLLALVDTKGKLGQAVRSRLANTGGGDIVAQAASGNYRPFAEYLAVRTGEAVVISGRASFESLPDVFEAKILSAKMGKNGGMKLDGKTGAEVPGPKLALALELKAICVEAVAKAAEMHAKRKAEKEANEAAKAE
jgi:hypothetical protein